MGLFSKDKNKYLHGFAKTNDSLGKKLRFVTENKKQNKEDFMEQLMVTLIEADIGYKTSEIICDRFFETCQNYFRLHADDLMEFLKDTNAIYYMLLSNERKDYTIFRNEMRNFDEEKLKFEISELMECLLNRGLIKGIDLTKDEQAIEIWLSIDGEAFVYYFFPYG